MKSLKRILIIAAVSLWEHMFSKRFLTAQQP